MTIRGSKWILVAAALLTLLLGSLRLGGWSPRRAYAQTSTGESTGRSDKDAGKGGASDKKADLGPSAGTGTGADAGADAGADDDGPAVTGLTAGKPTTVYVGFYIYNLHSVDLKEATFQVHFYFWMRYPKLKVAPDKYKDAREALEKIEWTNGKIDMLEEQDRKEDVNGVTYACWKAEGTFRFVPMLQQYPFDRQKLELRIEHPKYEADTVIFAEDNEEKSATQPERRGLKESVSIPEFQIVSTGRQTSESTYLTNFGDPTDARSESNYSRHVLTITIDREAGSFFFKIIMPLMVILAMGYLVFFLPPKEIQTASGLAMTALLTAIAFDVAVTQNLPDVGYLVVSDKFFIYTYILLFLNLMQSIITYNLFEAGKGEAAERWGKRCRVVFPVLYGIGFAILVAAAMGAREKV